MLPQKGRMRRRLLQLLLPKHRKNWRGTHGTNLMRTDAHFSASRNSRLNKNAKGFAFTPSELRTLRALKTPAGIQRFIDEMPYHLPITSWSPRVVLRERTAHCLEGA